LEARHKVPKAVKVVNGCHRFGGLIAFIIRAEIVLQPFERGFYANIF
jgi:hypothetical protein